MATIAKTVVATGASSSIGFEVIKQLLGQTQPYNFILGVRDMKATQTAYEELKVDTAKNKLDILPLQLSDLKGVRTFAQQTLEKLGNNKIDYLMLNAAISNGAETVGWNGSKWCDAYIVNSLSQHYLVHLLREKLISSKTRIVFVSSGGVRQVPDPSVLDAHLKNNSGIDGFTTYPETKFVQLLTAHWWRRELTGQCVVVAVSPGLIPYTRLWRGWKDSKPDFTIPTNMPDAKTIPEAGENVLRAFTRDDLPEDPEQIFLTSWGEWWPKDVYGLTLDKKLQEHWSPSKEEIEKEEDLA